MSDRYGMREKGRLVFFIILAVLTAAVYCAGTVYASQVQVHKKDTDTVIVGNSRVVGLWDSHYRTYSLIARSGGQYTTDDDHTIQSMRFGADKELETTLSKSRYTTIMNSIKAGLKKHHKCKVIVFTTINECRSDRVEAEGDIPEDVLDPAGKAVVNFAKKCVIKVKVRTTEKERALQKKKGKKPTKYIYVTSKVYVMQCVKESDAEKAEDHPFAYPYDHPNEYVKIYNSYVKKYCRQNGIKFVTFSREPKESEYTDDGLHFKKVKVGYNALMWKTLKELPFKRAV